MADARNLRVEETLRDGTRVMIRAARPDDRERIARAFHGLERDSVYTRFFTYKDALTTAELARLDVMDFARDVMLLCQQRDPSRMPAAYPLTSAAAPAPADKHAEVKPLIKAGG